MSSLQNTPLSEQLRIVLFGLRNSGKSYLMNNIFEKEVSIVSDNAGTTTDPVTRSMEMGILGPVSITDTAGLDDIGELGALRIRKSVDRLSVCDISIFVTRADLPPKEEEKKLFYEIAEKNKVVVFALTFADNSINEEKINWVGNYPKVLIDNVGKKGLDELKKTLISLSDKLEYEITPVEGLVSENDFVILVTPIDLAAPKGRLILPQVETIRDLLDRDCGILIVKERELKYFYDSLKIKPKLVITDSQAFSKVAADIPDDQMLTSFSILFARKKGDLSYFVEGIKKLKSVPPDSKVLVLESCSHHKQADDIGTVKIPRLFKQLVQSKVEFEFAHNIPDEKKLKEYFLTINCAGCMVSKNRMKRRLEALKENNVYSINYGLFLAWVNGLLPRALEPFPLEYELYNRD
ncbi:MAG: [FeFe] hydrogenase H-cluster maturation GTPase HydF [Spirochaetes bacterium GWD1_27_9]|nr:MAG: [FeFe] hydrogenase H-cluster maturation GTPase HydF [Spirochaetes bacterium GWB1_27_13]OHD28067.1 MAG: [FeFe] hydrogenase H-cluster maturation GTPase HydF [Spirochaetes bacterium GWC1_27_15]OHD41757.1 MAG: [FeFe] hydrogenase H-cluster maturation GTPase HydF [Spirochaetes bacterium GWD1_27_9]